jgi:membrane-anchored glycerophosphoryl diester phosphodiesterase (GDPDase)
MGVLFYFYIPIRVVLIFPMTAVDVRGTIGQAWRDSKGHFWQIFKVYFVAWAPFLAAVVFGISVVVHCNPWLIVITPAGFLSVSVVLAAFYASWRAIINARLFQTFAVDVGPAVR